MRNQRNPRLAGRNRHHQRRQRKHRKLRPRRQLDAVKQRRRHRVSRQQIAEQPEDRPTRAEHRCRRADHTGQHDLGNSRECADRNEKQMESEPRRPPFDQQPRDQQRDRVGNEMADRGVCVDAGDDRPRIGGYRRRKYEESDEADQPREELQDEDNAKDTQGFERWTSRGGHSWSVFVVVA